LHPRDPGYAVADTAEGLLRSADTHHDCFSDGHCLSDGQSSHNA
jgi:hypothetical protein